MERSIFLLLFLFFSLFSTGIAQITDAPREDNYSQYLRGDPSRLAGERIFFVRTDLVSGVLVGDIYSMSPAGIDIQQHTNFAIDYARTQLPKLSSDGRVLAFISNLKSWKSAYYWDAFLIDLTTYAVKRITGYERTGEVKTTGTVNVTVNDPKGFAISPSAVRISYSGCTDFVTGKSAALTVPADEQIWIKAEIARGKGDTKLVTVPAGGNAAVQLDLTNGTIEAASVSPSFNGQYFAVSTNSETVTDTGKSFPWFKILIWDTNQKIPVAEVQGQTVGGMKFGGDIDPAFSPDASVLAFGTGYLTLSSLATVPTTNVAVQPNILVPSTSLGTQKFCTQPAWSPNGSEIAFTYITITSTFFGIELHSNIYKVPVGGGTPQQITNFSGREVASGASYSPDGSKIAFNLSTSKGSVFLLTDLALGNFTNNIHMIPSNGGTSIALTNDGKSGDPSWGVVNSATKVTEEKEIPENFLLSQNFPNPFNPTTTIKYEIPATLDVGTGVDLKIASTDKLQTGQHLSVRQPYVKLIIFDILGREIKTLVDEYQNPGYYEVQFNGVNLPSGIYYYRLEAGGVIQTKRMVLLK